MMHLFTSGELLRAPERRATKDGRPYATALLRVGDDLVNLAVFDSELAERLAVLQKGDPLAVAGRLQVSGYVDKAGEHRCGLSVTATQLMAAPARTTEAKPRARPKPACRRGRARGLQRRHSILNPQPREDPMSEASAAARLYPSQPGDQAAKAFATLTS